MDRSKTLAQIKDKFWLSRTPTYSEIKSYESTWQWSKQLISNKGKSWELAQIKDKFWLSRTPTFSEIKSYQSTGQWNEDLKPFDIYAERDKYLTSYVWALGESFDKETKIRLWDFAKTKDDMDLSMDYYRKDFEKITSRKTQDYYKWIALQNKEFSKSLDYVSNYASKTIWALQWFGKNRIIEATWDKMESEARYKLDFSRSIEDLDTQKAREEARYKLNNLRLAEQKSQYESSRDTEKKVKTIEATWTIATYYDSLIWWKTIAEDEAAARRKDITWWGTWVEKIFNY